MALHSRDAVTVYAAVATRSRADCSSMEGHTSLSTVLVRLGPTHKNIYNSNYNTEMSNTQCNAGDPLETPADLYRRPPSKLTLIQY